MTTNTDCRLAPAPQLPRELIDIPQHIRRHRPVVSTLPQQQWAAGTAEDGGVPLRDITVLYGTAGVGKTTLATQWALAQSRGEPLFGLIPMRKMPVLLVACEDPVEELHRQFAKQGMRGDEDIRIVTGFGTDTMLNPSFEYAPPDAPDTPMYQRLDRVLGSMPAGPKLLILHNLMHVYQGDYRDPADVARFVSVYLRRLIRTHQATLLLVGLTEHETPAWSRTLANRIYLSRSRVKGERILSRQNVTRGDGIRLGWQDWVFVPALQPGAAPAPSSRARRPIVQVH